MESMMEERISTREMKGTVVIKVRQFSNVRVHTPNAESSGFIDIELRGAKRIHWNHTTIKVYPNGRNSSTEGQVSLNFQCPLNVCQWTDGIFDLACTIEIIDVEGCRRFPQSFRFVHDPESGQLPDFFVDKYVKRDFLLTNADEVLPDDTLIIHVDMIVRQYHTCTEEEYLRSLQMVREKVDGSCKIEKDGEGKKHYYLSLNSGIAKLLAEESPYFERLCATPMSEKDLGYVEIPYDTCWTFGFMVNILWCLDVQDMLLPASFEYIFELYALADYYMIGSVLDTCRRWLRLACRTREDATAIAEIANSYNDAELLKIAEAAANRIERETDNGGAGGSDSSVQDDEVWTCVRIAPSTKCKKCRRERLGSRRTCISFEFGRRPHLRTAQRTNYFY